MRTGNVLMLALVTMTLATPAAIADGEERVPAWLRAIVVDESGSVALAWEPVPGATSYRVYGVSGNTYTLIEETKATATIVPHTFPNYAVTAIVDGLEGEARLAESCIHIAIDWATSPPVKVAIGCI